MRKGLASDRQSIRVRLGLAMAVALLPVLLLGAVQSLVAFRKDAQERRATLTAATEWSAATARARLQSAVVLLEAISPATAGDECTPRLQLLMRASHGFSNLVRLDSSGHARCAAQTVMGGEDTHDEAWFKRLQAGEQVVVQRAKEGSYADVPSALIAARAPDENGRFDGALLALIRLESLRPRLDQTTPAGAQVALINREGQILTRSEASAFATPPNGWRLDRVKSRPMLFDGVDAGGGRRVYSVAPLLSDEVFVVMSAPSPGLFSWARLNVISSVLFPLVAFALALLAVWVVTESVVVRWLHYVERIAAIYAKGRFTVRPLRAERAPPEIRGLAHTLDDMADAIVSRDLSLRESLAQKDAMMREIHHRVKNNLQVITSLLNMQQRALTDPAARAAMTDTRQRISALALIYRALYQGPDLKKVDLRHFLEELIAQIISSDAQGGPAVRTELDADDLIIDPDKLAPLALFAVEAVTNAQKHAFAGHGGTLRVRFKVEGDNARLEIADDAEGPQLSGAAAEEASAVIGQGVGQVLMTAFARQLRGRAEYVRNIWGGTTATLIFPTPEAPQTHEDGSSANDRNQAAA